MYVCARALCSFIDRPIGRSTPTIYKPRAPPGPQMGARQNKIIHPITRPTTDKTTQQHAHGGSGGGGEGRRRHHRSGHGPPGACVRACMRCSCLLSLFSHHIHAYMCVRGCVLLPNFRSSPPPFLPSPFSLSTPPPTPKKNTKTNPHLHTQVCALVNGATAPSLAWHPRALLLAFAAEGNGSDAMSMSGMGGGGGNAMGMPGGGGGGFGSLVGDRGRGGGLKEENVRFVSVSDRA